jgi:hypothetical protein
MKAAAILRSTIVAALVGPTISCSEPLVCTEPGRRSMVVTISDASTGRPAAYQARLILRSDARVDTVVDFVPAADSLRVDQIWSFAHPGVYTVTVEKDGYAPWIKERVQLRATDRCGSVATVHLDVNLSPL